jgi:hypothetical protein
MRLVGQRLRGLRVLLFQGFRWVQKDGWDILDAPPLSACSAGSLADRPCQLLSGGRGDRLKQ